MADILKKEVTTVECPVSEENIIREADVGLLNTERNGKTKPTSNEGKCQENVQIKIEPQEECEKSLSNNCEMSVIPTENSMEVSAQTFIGEISTVAESKPNIMSETQDAAQSPSISVVTICEKQNHEINEKQNKDYVDKNRQSCEMMVYREDSGTDDSDSSSSSSSESELSDEDKCSSDVQTETSPNNNSKNTTKKEIKEDLNSIRKFRETIRTKGEIFPDELPMIEDLQITVDEGEVLKMVGKITGIVDVLVVIQSEKDIPALNEDTILFKEDRQVFGKIFEVFGPVKLPIYSVRFNSAEDIKSRGIEIAQSVFCAPRKEDFTQYVFVDKIARMKGSDASWEYNQEPPSENVDYSDDEQEKRASALAKQQRRNQIRAREGDTNEDWRPPCKTRPKRPRKQVNRQGRNGNSGNVQNAGFQFQPARDLAGPGETDCLPNTWQLRQGRQSQFLGNQGETNQAPSYPQYHGNFPPQRMNSPQQFAGPPNFRPGPNHNMSPSTCWPPKDHRPSFGQQNRPSFNRPQLHNWGNYSGPQMHQNNCSSPRFQGQQWPQPPQNENSYFNQGLPSFEQHLFQGPPSNPNHNMTQGNFSQNTSPQLFEQNQPPPNLQFNQSIAIQKPPVPIDRRYVQNENNK